MVVISTGESRAVRDVFCLININDKRRSFIRLLSQDLFHGSNTDTHVFSSATVYINLRQNRQGLWGLARTTILMSFCVYLAT